MRVQVPRDEEEDRPWIRLSKLYTVFIYRLFSRSQDHISLARPHPPQHYKLYARAGLGEIGRVVGENNSNRVEKLIGTRQCEVDEQIVADAPEPTDPDQPEVQVHSLSHKLMNVYGKWRVPSQFTEPIWGMSDEKMIEMPAVINRVGGQDSRFISHLRQLVSKIVVNKVNGF